MRTSFLFLAAAMAAIGCGDDTVAATGSGGGSTSSTTAGSTTGSSTTSSTATSSTGEGAGPGSTGSGDGGSGDGGSSGDGGGGVGGFETGDTVTEACQNFNLMNEAFAEELGCVLAEPCAREEPDMCADELLAFFNCRLENTTIDECTCQGGGGEGGAGGGGEGGSGDIFCEDTDGECSQEGIDLNDCFGI